MAARQHAMQPQECVGGITVAVDEPVHDHDVRVMTDCWKMTSGMYVDMASGVG
jgi:hypothetical protein